MSMDSIVAETGGSKATLYPNCPSKDAPFGGIVDDLQQQPAAVPPAPDYVDLPNPEGLRKLERAMADAALSEPAIVSLRLAAVEFSPLPTLADLVLTQAPGRSYGRSRDYLEAKQDGDEVDVGDHQIAAEHSLAGRVGHQQLLMLLAPTHRHPTRSTSESTRQSRRSLATTAQRHQHDEPRRTSAARWQRLGDDNRSRCDRGSCDAGDHDRRGPPTYSLYGWGSPPETMKGCTQIAS